MTPRSRRMGGSARTTETDLDMPSVGRVMQVAWRTARLHCPHCGKGWVLKSFNAARDHTFVVTAARAGLTLLVIPDLLGHSDISFTQRYAQYAPDNDRSRHQAAAIGKFLAIDAVHIPPLPQKPELKYHVQALRRGRLVSQELLLS